MQTGQSQCDLGIRRIDGKFARLNISHFYRALFLECTQAALQVVNDQLGALVLLDLETQLFFSDENLHSLLLQV